MTPRERAEDLIRRFDEPVRDIANYRVQAMLSMTEEAIAAAVEEKEAEIEEWKRRAGLVDMNKLDAQAEELARQHTLEAIRKLKQTGFTLIELLERCQIYGPADVCREAADRLNALINDGGTK